MEGSALKGGDIRHPRRTHTRCRQILYDEPHTSSGNICLRASCCSNQPYSRTLMAPHFSHHCASDAVQHKIVCQYKESAGSFGSAGLIMKVPAEDEASMTVAGYMPSCQHRKRIQNRMPRGSSLGSKGRNSRGHLTQNKFHDM